LSYRPPADHQVSAQYRTFRSAPNISTAQRTDSNKLLVTAELPLAQSAFLRPTTPLRHGRHQKTNKFGSATEESVLPPKNQQQKLHRHHELHLHFPSPPLRISSPPTLGRGGSRWRIANIPPLVVGGNGLAVHQNPHSPSLTNPGEGSSWPSLPPALDIRSLLGERLHW
jgi:hypothetical protein